MAATKVRLAPTGKFLDVGGAGGGDGITTLYFIDPATSVPGDEQTGSAVAPFATLAQGVAALASQGYAGALFLADGDYAGEGLTWQPPSDESGAVHGLTLLGSGFAQNVGDVLAVQPDESTVVELVFRGIGTPVLTPAATGAITASGLVQVACYESYLGPVSGSDLLFHAADSQIASLGVDSARLVESAIDGAAEIEGELVAESSRFNDAVVTGTLSPETVRVVGCRFSEAVDFSGSNETAAVDCVFVSTLALGVAGELTGCRFGAAVTGTTIRLTDCVANDSVSGSDGEIFGGRFGGDLTFTGALSLRQSEVLTDGAPEISVGTVLRVVDSQLTASVSTAGDAIWDRKSYEFQRLQDNPLSVGGDLLFSDVPAAAVQLGYTAGAASDTLTVLPAGHAPGVYHVAPCAVIRTAAGAGTINPAISFVAPALGAASVVSGAVSITAQGMQLGSPRQIVSDGSEAITVDWTPDSVAGSPVIDLYAAAQFVAPLPTGL